ncbi:hypothetical protein [Roseiterribacter gracilis]|uniref:Uncharacterized protein n=1 Tax=Roseiterribacter gracilis TaxID=2812848 RepID=A0A8S8XEX5_9PROT|nr:hypothetical protein TMPK1_27890 [Rhodospirillales bacterium TMPK1]
MKNVEIHTEAGGLHSVELENAEDLLRVIREAAGLGEDAHVFEHDGEEPLIDIEIVRDRKALVMVVHRCRQVQVTVRFDQEKSKAFPPSATIYRILKWAVGKQGFNLDPDQAGKANLTLPNAVSPLPKDTVVGTLTDGATCSSHLVLTLKDFTNG